MRRVAMLLCLVVITPLAAQSRARVNRMPPDWQNALPQYEKRVQNLTASIKRDAFIISRVTLAMGDLSDDFQKLSAIQKAHDRIVEAQVRAGEEPQAGPWTKTAIGKMLDEIERLKLQGTMADLGALREFIMKQSHPIQRELFSELSEARGERLNLIELLNKVQTMNADLEASMVEALGTTFDYMGSGGK